MVIFKGFWKGPVKLDLIEIMGSFWSLVLPARFAGWCSDFLIMPDGIQVLESLFRGWGILGDTLMNKRVFSAGLAYNTDQNPY